MPTLLIIVLACGGVGLSLVLPGGRRDLARLGWLVLAAAGGMLVAALLRHLAGQTGAALFAGGSLVALFAAVRVITHRKPVYSALYFVLLVVAVTLLLVQMQAEFLAAALVIVYAGAILVTYVFVIMLAQQARPAVYDTRAREPLWGCLGGFALLALLGSYLFGVDKPAYSSLPGALPAGTVEAVGTLLLTEYLVGIQLVGLLLLAALVGAIAIARRRAADKSEPEGMD